MWKSIRNWISEDRQTIGTTPVKHAILRGHRPS